MTIAGICLISCTYVLGKQLIKRPARDACLCMGELQAPAAPAAPHFVFLITLYPLGGFFSNLAGLGSSLGEFF